MSPLTDHMLQRIIIMVKSATYTGLFYNLEQVIELQMGAGLPLHSRFNTSTTYHDPFQPYCKHIKVVRFYLFGSTPTYASHPNNSQCGPNNFSRTRAVRTYSKIRKHANGNITFVGRLDYRHKHTTGPRSDILQQHSSTTWWLFRFQICCYNNFKVFRGEPCQRPAPGWSWQGSQS